MIPLIVLDHVQSKCIIDKLNSTLNLNIALLLTSLTLNCKKKLLYEIK